MPGWILFRRNIGLAQLKVRLAVAHFQPNMAIDISTGVHRSHTDHNRKSRMHVFSFLHQTDCSCLKFVAKTKLKRGTSTCYSVWKIRLEVLHSSVS